ncbi:MAG: hypothetical protein ABIR37_00580 [Candidatus Saccharimonadales bacterium]
MNIKRLIAGLAATPLVAALAMPLTAFAATTVTVTPTNTQGWSTADTRPGGTVTYVTDNTSPLPTGALQLSTDATNAAKAQYMHAANVALSDVTALSYETKQVAGPRNLDDASYQLPVDLNNDGTFDMTLVYEPYYNGTVTPGTWQTWNVKDGLFWPTKVDASLGGTPAGGAYATNFTLQHVLDVYPNAHVLGYGVNVGSYNPSTTVNVDNFVFDEVTYNFEKATTPTDKDKCKNDGWKNFNSPTFKNQGDCVSFVASAKTSNYKLDSGNKDGLNIPTTKGAYYEVTVKGTWTNRPGEVVDAECTNMRSSTWQNAVEGGIYSPDLLDTQVNNAFVDWGTCDATNHSYTKWVVADDNTMNLRVFDGDTSTNQQDPSWFGDNNGSLDVTVVAHKI